MLLPRYSLRASLITISSCSVFFLILGQAYQQKPWAIVVTVAVISLGVILLFHAMTYITCLVWSMIVTAQQTPARTSRGGVQSNPDDQAPPTAGEVV